MVMGCTVATVRDGAPAMVRVAPGRTRRGKAMVEKMKVKAHWRRRNRVVKGRRPELEEMAQSLRTLDGTQKLRDGQGRSGSGTRGDANKIVRDSPR